jgi:hypothetical protein
MNQQVGAPLSFGVDVTPDRAYSSIAAASRLEDNRVTVEVIQHQPGASWLSTRLAELNERWQPTYVVFDRSSPAGRMAGDLRTLGLPILETDAGSYAGACGAFYDAIVDGTVCHRGQLLLDTAVAAARKRNIGDTWAWARRVGVDMTPLVAATLAHHAIVSQGAGWFIT